MLFLGTSFMLVVAVAVSFAVQVTVSSSIFSLMVTVGGCPRSICRDVPGTAIALSVGFSLMATWAGLFVGFYTIYPVSFFITAIAFSLTSSSGGEVWNKGRDGHSGLQEKVIRMLHDQKTNRDWDLTANDGMQSRLLG